MSQRLPVKLDVFLFQTIDKVAVCQVEFPDCCIEAHDPERPEMALALPAVAQGVFSCAEKGVFCKGEVVLCSPKIFFLDHW